MPRIEFFAGNARPLWKKFGGTAENFKIRVNGKYVVREGERHSFFDRDGVAWYVMHHLAEGLGCEKPEIPAEGKPIPVPNIPISSPLGTKVVVQGRESFDSITRSPITYDPLIEDWVVIVLGVRGPVRISDLELR